MFQLGRHHDLGSRCLLGVDGKLAGLMLCDEKSDSELEKRMPGNIQILSKCFDVLSFFLRKVNGNWIVLHVCGLSVVSG